MSRHPTRGQADGDVESRVGENGEEDPSAGPVDQPNEKDPERDEHQMSQPEPLRPDSQLVVIRAFEEAEW